MLAQNPLIVYGQVRIDKKELHWNLKNRSSVFKFLSILVKNHDALIR